MRSTRENLPEPMLVATARRRWRVKAVAIAMGQVALTAALVVAAHAVGLT